MSLSPGDVIALIQISSQCTTTLVEVIKELRERGGNKKVKNAIAYFEDVQTHLQSLGQESVVNSLRPESRIPCQKHIKSTDEMLLKFLGEIKQRKTGPKRNWLIAVMLFFQLFRQHWSFDTRVAKLQNDVSHRVHIIHGTIQKDTLLTTTSIYAEVRKSDDKPNNFVRGMRRKASELTRSFHAQNHKAIQKPQPANRVRARVTVISGTIPGGLKNAENMVAQLPSIPDNIAEATVGPPSLLEGPSTSASTPEPAISLVDGFPQLRTGPDNRSGRLTFENHTPITEEAALASVWEDMKEFIIWPNVQEYSGDDALASTSSSSPPLLILDGSSNDNHGITETPTSLREIQETDREIPQPEPTESFSPDGIPVSPDAEIHPNPERPSVGAEESGPSTGGQDDDIESVASDGEGNDDVQEVPNAAAGCTHDGDIGVAVGIIALVVWNYEWRRFKCKTCGTVVSESATSTILNVSDEGSVSYNWNHGLIPGGFGVWGTVNGREVEGVFHNRVSVRRLLAVLD